MKKTYAWALIDNHGRLWLDGWDGQPTLTLSRAELKEELKTYACPHLWRICRVLITEVKKR